jgi:hypothetical protein
VALALGDENNVLRDLLAAALEDYDQLAAELLCRAERLRRQLDEVDAAAGGGRTQ